MGSHDQGANATSGRWLVIPRTLCFVQNGDDLLLMKRAAHRRVFPNKYNGLGGHIERHEDPLSGAKREILEESGLAVENIKLRSIHNIDTGKETGIMLFVYTATSSTREFTEDGIEGTLHWVPIKQLQEYDLVEDLPLVLPRILDGAEDAPPFSAHVSYDERDEILIRFVAT